MKHSQAAVRPGSQSPPEAGQPWSRLLLLPHKSPHLWSSAPSHGPGLSTAWFQREASQSEYRVQTLLSLSRNRDGSKCPRRLKIL